jgi:hypothetical protein
MLLTAVIQFEIETNDWYDYQDKEDIMWFTDEVLGGKFGLFSATCGDTLNNWSVPLSSYNLTPVGEHND